MFMLRVFSHSLGHFYKDQQLELYASYYKMQYFPLYMTQQVCLTIGISLQDYNKECVILKGGQEYTQSMKCFRK